MIVLDAINNMLAALGETPLSADDADYTEHPLYESALRILDNERRKVLSRGWWFNTRHATLSPTAHAIAIDASILSVEVIPNGYPTQYTIRAGALYNLTDATAVIDTDLDVKIRELVAFADLPETAAQYIAARATTQFVKTYDGDSAKLHSVQEEEQLAYIPFNSDHIQNSRVNMYATASMGRVLSNVWYQRYRQR